MDPVVARLAEPITPESPCGEDLEDTPLLASFDAYRLFGQMAPLADDTDWREIRDKSLEALEQSRDLRLLAHLAAAVLRTDGLPRFCDVLQVAGQWFSAWPEQLFPRIDDDAILRKNALNSFGDRMAIVDGVRRRPFIANPQIGAFTLRDVEIATGKLAPSESGGEPPSEAHLNAVLAAADDAQLATLESGLGAAIAALRAIESGMRDAHGPEGMPEFDLLLGALGDIRRLLAEQLATRAANALPVAGADGDGAATGPGAAAVIGVGSIRSRDDAIRALDAVATFFRSNEPSSPVPLFVERAKRLIGKDFIEVLADMAPDGLDQARHVGGVQEE